MKVRLTQLDGKLPNLALMKLAAYHRREGDEITFSGLPRRQMFEPAYDRVYGSAIFSRSAPIVAAFQADFPEAVVGGTGTSDARTVEDQIEEPAFEQYDYSMYPNFPASIGFTARGCRLKCGFCVVPKKEGKPQSINTIADIWRGAPYPRHLHLLDNDFFGQPKEQWRARVCEMIDGNFKVCFNQGINVRMIDDESAAVLASLRYYDDGFTVRRLYTAWDNLKDEGIFVRGVERLFAAGIKPDHLLVYMLVGYDSSETWERIFHRFDIMRAMGVRPFPMVYDPTRRDLKDFQRWVIRRHYHRVSWDDYRKGDAEGRRRHHFMAERSDSLFGGAA